ncbi:MAG: hypothetical protein GQ535_09700 [Rhodobacteraceae bacterium]|nr:hypothetical protein [Paracoccaceae bacterium]
MAKIRILSVKKIDVDSSGFTNVMAPNSSFYVVITVDKAQEPLLDAKTRKLLETSAKDFYKKFLVQTVKQLQKFDKLFAGMLAKGAAPEAVKKQANTLKLALEKETPKWEKAAAHAAMDQLEKLAKKKR